MTTVSAESLLLLVGSVMAALVVTVIALSVHRRRRARGRVGVAALPQETAVAAPARLTALDGAALLSAVKEAEAEGQTKRLPGLYLSLARWRIESKETSAAEELLRKCILAATTQGQKDCHARGRLALGDIALSKGDPVTACEHWQTARSLFGELDLSQEHDVVEARMRRNGCPTDWVLTDF